MENKEAKISVLSALLISFMLWAIVPMISSCGKNAAVAPTASSTKLRIIDASPDLLPMYVYIGNLQLGTTYFNYPTVTSYYSVYSGTQTTRINNHLNISIIYINDTLANNANYSLYVVGSVASVAPATDTLGYILTADTAVIPQLGYGKIRFVNASARTGSLDVYANGTQAFSAVPFKGVSKFISVPAGLYTFKINATATPASTLTTLVPPVTIQDGHLYTLYTHGLVGRTDSAAFTAAVLANQ